MNRPPRRDEVWLVTLDPTHGAEIQKTRPCLVVSPDEMNRYLQTVSVDRERLSVATTNFADGTGGNARAYIACLLEHHGFVFSTCFSGRMSYSGWGTPISHLSSQPTM